jgi:hypothetical protein
MALVSPGVEVSIIDESQYVPSSTNSVPYILIATAQDKVSGSGVGVAAGTLKANANRVYLITSQRDLTATFGNPFFYTTTTGTPINGYELNEYGLLAAYSAMGLTNRAYIQRADVNLTELTGSLSRPFNAPANNSYWFDTASSTNGVFTWNNVTNQFTLQAVSEIVDSNDLVGGLPSNALGTAGSYVVNALSIYNPLYYKMTTPNNTQLGNPGASPTLPTAYPGFTALNNTWTQVGSTAWQSSAPTVQGANTPQTGALESGSTFLINGDTITITATTIDTVAGIVAFINGGGVGGTQFANIVAANIAGKLVLYYTAFNGAPTDPLYVNKIVVQQGTFITANPLAVLGITVVAAPGGGYPSNSFPYGAPNYLVAPSYSQPRWRISDLGVTGAVPSATGSIWQKSNNVSGGASTVIKKYNSTLGTFIQQQAPWYPSDAEVNYNLDPSGGGVNLAAGSTYTQYSCLGVNPSTQLPLASYQIFQRLASGDTVITGIDTTPGPFVIGDTFTIQASSAGTGNMLPTTGAVTATVLGTTALDFVNAFSLAATAAQLPVLAQINSSGQIVLTHGDGGSIYLQNTTALGRNPVALAGFVPYNPSSPTTAFTLGVYVLNASTVNPVLVLSNWVTAPTFVYTAEDNTPNTAPADGRLWYYSDPTQVDIMIQNNGTWQGYQTVTNSVRNENLSVCNATGPIISATPPTTQTNASQSPLVPGDLWINTSDLENYPQIYRWESSNGMFQWVLLDNTDQTSSNGVLFADARWSPTGTANPITDPLPSIVSLLTSGYLDADAPNPDLYPQGMLLFNTRRSGFNVKTYQTNYFNNGTWGIDEYNSGTTYVYNDFVNFGGIVYVCITTTSVTNVPPTDPTAWTAIEVNSWVTASGNKIDGSPYTGRQAQRAIIVEALKSGIDTSVSAREEQLTFNLLACPQYPELAPNLVALNNERGATGFSILDTPLRLSPENVVTWATNNNGTGLATADGLLVGDAYAGTFYPSCQTTDLTGTPVVQPPSHMMIRTIIKSDSVSYPWFAPAGTRRGVIDNAALLGYINAQTSEFETIGVRRGLRDVLYENRVNPITFIPGVGITNYGNKTTTSNLSALDRINVARLVAFLRGRLESIAKQFLFEPNDQITRNSVTSAIDGLMIDLVAKRGIYDYLVVCDASNNTPARIDRNELYVDIAIEPVKSVEFIYIPVRIKNTGAIAAGL